MDDIKRKRIRRLTYLLSAIFFAGVVFFVLRGPYISNALKRIIQPELEALTGRKVITQKIFINLFPLFAEAKDIKVFDDKGERILTVKRAKAYIDLSGFLNGNLVMRRLVISEPQFSTDRKQAEEIVAHVRSYLAAPRKTALKVKVLVIEVQKGNVRLADADNKAVSEVGGLNAEAILGVSPRIRASAKKIGVTKEGWPDIEGEGDLDLSVRNGTVSVKKFSVRSLGSRMTGGGEYSEGGGNFAYDARIMVTSLKKMFHLEKNGQGQLNAEGRVDYRDGGISGDMKVEGNFFVQTLMELLKVKEQVEGLVEVKGGIKGPLKNLKGYGDLSLRKGNLFGVEVESLTCKVSYADGKMDFTEGSGTLYHGTAKLSASLNLPVVNSYTVQVDFKDVDSKPVFALIGWDPGIQPGKVSGGLKTSGATFDPEGSFLYRSVTAGKDVLGRIGNVSGSFRKRGDVISLADLKLDTAKSKIYAKGTADIERKEVAMDVVMKTNDLLDLTAPYYAKLKGQGEFTGSVRGAFSDPVISGDLKIMDPFFEGYKAATMKADVSYRKNLLEIRDLAAEGGGAAARARGDVYFKNAKELFDLAGAVYKVDATMKNADLERFARIFYPEFRGTGRVGGVVKVRGSEDDPKLSGDGRVEKAVIYGVPFDHATFGWSYAARRLNFDKMKIVRGNSVISADAGLEASGSFFYKASADRILLSDILGRELRGEAVFSLKSEGRGTFDNPAASLTAHMKEGRLGERPIHGGVIAASVKDKNISFSAVLLDDNIRIAGKGRLEKDIPWEAEADVQTGRYDAIISALLKDVPEDLLLSLHGKVLLHGDKEHIFASSTINQVTLSMYGYTFTNDEEIKFNLSDRRLTLNKVMLRSGNTSLRIEGNLELGREYNLVVEGNSSLAPLKSLSKKIGFLRGEGDFVLAVTGNWDTPEINGGVTVTNGAIALKEYSYRLSSLSGYLYMDNDRIILQKLSGKIGGGDIDLSGVLYLKKFSVKRYYIEAGMSNVTASFSSDFAVNFGGNLLLKGDPESRLISGDIKINRARYKERIEWKSWLLKTRKSEAFKGEISSLEKTELNIRVTGKENIRVDNNVARADAMVELILRGTVSHPVLFGRTEFASGGAVYFRNNEFRILHASADFTDPNRINPYISISADTVVKGYKIKMNLEGHLDHFNMSLSSDPILKEMDVLSLLTVGQTGGELKGLEGGIGASEATSFVTGKLQDVIEERLRSVTGLDRFQIDPHVSKITGTVEPRVTVSKRLLGDRVFVTFTSAVGSTEEQIIKLEYFLSRSISLVGVRDERGILGGDVRFRFEFK
jgi:hypothetical protein